MVIKGLELTRALELMRPSPVDWQRVIQAHEFRDRAVY